MSRQKARANDENNILETLKEILNDAGTGDPKIIGARLNKVSNQLGGSTKALQINIAEKFGRSFAKLARQGKELDRGK